MNPKPADGHVDRKDPGVGGVGQANIRSGGAVGQAHFGTARMPAVAAKGKAIKATKAFAFPQSKDAQSMPAEHAGKAAPGDNRPVDLSFSAADGDIRGTLAVALSLTRHTNDKEQRIVVVGDADFLSNAELSRTNLNSCNFDFATSVFGWFSYGKFPIDIVRPEPKDNRVSVSDQGITMMKIFFMGILPALAAVMGSILLLRRRRK